VFLTLIDEPIVMVHAIGSWLGNVMWSSDRAAVPSLTGLRGQALIGRPARRSPAVSPA